MGRSVLPVAEALVVQVPKNLDICAVEQSPEHRRVNTR